VSQTTRLLGAWVHKPALALASLTTPLELPHIVALTNKINLLKECGITRVCVAAHRLAHRVNPLKKKILLGWEYSGFQDLTQEISNKITLEHLMKLLEEMFQDTSSWPIDEQVSSYHIRVDRDTVWCAGQYNFSCFP
jgi:hypothetical protein